MWRPRFPRGNSDGWLAVGLAVGLPSIFLLTQGVPLMETAITAVLIGGVLLVIHG
jgi:hypothetical protein